MTPYVWFLVAQLCGTSCVTVYERGPFLEAVQCQDAGREAKAKPDPRVSRFICEHRKVKTT